MILAATSLDSFVQLITVLIIFVFVLILTYFTTRWMAGIQKGRSFNKNLRIIETISVGNNKMISIVEAGTKYIVVSIGKDDVNYLTELKEVIHLRGSVIPIIRLDKMLDIEPKEQEPDHLTVVIVQKGDQQAGLVVDNLIGQQEIVIKSLGKYINGNKLISGATILGDGDVALILDVNTLM